ncbi:MAG: NnrS family protein [Rhodospirillales bacterium]
MPIEDWQGPRLLAEGFRPFFLAAGASAVAGVALWVLSLAGVIELDTFLAPVAWHAHEMIFGMAAAAVAGFLLTAVPNWTGRLPVRGWPLAGLVAIWLAGRIAMVLNVPGMGVVAAVVDLLFLLSLAGVAFREIAAGRNWRNLPVIAALVMLLAANGVTHAEALGYLNDDGTGLRLGVAVLIVLITLIGGRIIPSFTGNWLAKQVNEARPRAFGPYDRVCLIVTSIALAGWSVAPDSSAISVTLITAGVLNGGRLASWRGHRTLGEPLVWSLHLGFFWVPIGLIMLGTSTFMSAVPTSAGVHALTAGAIGGMITAVMTRATLGHTGRELHADAVTAAIYGLVFVATVFRVGAGIAPGMFIEMLVASAAAWCGAFLIFCVRFGPHLAGR